LLQEFGHMKCLEFVQMHGIGPVANRSAGDRNSDNRVDMLITGCRPWLGLVIPAILALSRIRDALWKL
jgi:hypothetical protein